MRFSLVLFNVIFAFLGITMIIIGELHGFHTSYLTDLTPSVKVDDVLKAAGCLLLVTMIMGAVLATIEIKWLFIAYGVMLLITHCCQVVVCVLSFLESLTLDWYIHGPLIWKFESFYNESFVNESVDSQVNRLQREWQCCGLHNLTNFDKPLASTCCPTLSKNETCKREKAWRRDCKRAAMQIIYGPIRTMGFFAMIFAVFQFFLALWSFYTASQVKRVHHV